MKIVTTLFALFLLLVSSVYCQSDMGCSLDGGLANGGCGPGYKCVKVPIMNHNTGKTVNRNMCLEKANLDVTLSTLQSKYEALTQTVPWNKPITPPTTSEPTTQAIIDGPGSSEYAAYFVDSGVTKGRLTVLQVSDIEDVNVMYMDNDLLLEAETFDYEEVQVLSNDYQD